MRGGEFGGAELFKYLISEAIDFHIRLKSSHLTGGKSFGRIWRNAAERVKWRGRVRTEVFRLMIYVSCVKYQKDGKTEYLIVASKERNKDAIEEYKVRRLCQFIAINHFSRSFRQILLARYFLKTTISGG